MTIISIIGVIILLSVSFTTCNYAESSGQSPKMPEVVSYNFDIRPILSDKCVACHGPDANKREAGLRMDDAQSAYAALAENPGAHALVPGTPELSQAYLRITSSDSDELMPPPASNLKLSQYEISLIEKWIRQGAKYEKHWAFTGPFKSALPAVRSKDWPKNEIDYFILQKQEQAGFDPNKEADKERLLKRLCLDLTGLPPSLAMMDDFLTDTAASAYERMVDKLLNSPAYGEKMSLHWLDLSRYADSYGYQDDGYRTQWPWRDWVIHAFNTNLHYDEFVTMQLAGDLMPDAGKENLLATGFSRNHKITEEGGAISEEYRTAYVADRTDLVGKGLLGVTMECARCHDHKYDPFSQKEYYQMFAFFNNVREKGFESVIGGPETYAKKPLMEISDQDVKSILGFVNKRDTNRLIVSIMDDLDTLRPTHILRRGEYDNIGDMVSAGTPAAILPFDSSLPKNRLGLAKWLFDKKNPLTARVYVNLIWQEFFGRGIVKTSGDFGMQGELPSHPRLLDWLAVDFVEHEWDIKRLVKKLVTSATYRQSADISPEKLEKDPENILLSRGPRFRIAAELIRDVILSSSGLLNKDIGGPSVKPYQPEGLWEGATSGRGLLSMYVQDHGPDLYRRGMYTLVKRTVPPPTMAIFDASSRDICETSRQRTNTPLQALVLMNDPTVLEASRVLGEKLMKQNSDMTSSIATAFRLIVCRKPKQKELEILIKYYSEQLDGMNENLAAKIITVGEYPSNPTANKKILAAFMRTISTIYNLEETITKS